MAVCAVLNAYYGIMVKIGLDFFYSKIESAPSEIKFIYSEKATKFCEISTVDLTVNT